MKRIKKNLKSGLPKAGSPPITEPPKEGYLIIAKPKNGSIEVIGDVSGLAKNYVKPRVPKVIVRKDNKLFELTVEGEKPKFTELSFYDTISAQTAELYRKEDKIF